MTKSRGINLDGYALTAIVTTPDATFIEFSMPKKGDVTEAVTFVDRGPAGLDKGDTVMISQIPQTQQAQL